MLQQVTGCQFLWDETLVNMAMAFVGKTAGEPRTCNRRCGICGWGERHSVWERGPWCQAKVFYLKLSHTITKPMAGFLAMYIHYSGLTGELKKGKMEGKDQGRGSLVG